MSDRRLRLRIARLGGERRRDPRPRRRRAPPGELRGWRRGFTLVRDNRACEKTFARRDDGSIPDYVLALNRRPPATGDWSTGRCSPSTERRARAARPCARSATGGSTSATRSRRTTWRPVRARPHLRRPPRAPRPGAAAGRGRSSPPTSGRSRRAFAGLGPGELDRYRTTTRAGAAERIDADLRRRTRSRPATRATGERRARRLRSSGTPLLRPVVERPQRRHERLARAR